MTVVFYAGNVEFVANTTIQPKKRAWNTQVFLKLCMAVSGVFFVLFVFMHAYGNLKILAGPEAYAGYAHHLRIFGEPILPENGLLWILRILLVVLLVIHFGSAYHLWYRANRARGKERYDVKKHVANNYATRTVRVGSVLLFIFIIFHLLHFTTKNFQIGDKVAYGDAMLKVPTDVVVNGGTSTMGFTEVPAAPWNMMVTTFSHWWMVAIYGLAVLILSIHVGHGIWSALQTVGWLRNNTRPVVIIISGILGGLLFLMFIIPPLYLLIAQPAMVGI